MMVTAEHGTQDMHADLHSQLCGPEKETLGYAVRRALGSDSAEPGEWSIEPLGGSMGAVTHGVYRLTGHASVGGREVPWSVILKVVSLGAPGAYPDFEDEAHPLYWKREALAYQSGLPDSLPGGIAAPRCYAAVETEGSADTMWLWLEDVRDAYASGWPLDQYARAAQILGRFNGAYLAGMPMPDHSWLVRSGSPRGLLDHNLWAREIVASPRTWQHPLVRPAFPTPAAGRMLRLWDEREVLLRALDNVPHTLCHLDAWRRNMFATRVHEHRTSPDDSGRLVLVDWAYPGRGAVGTDPGDLFAAGYSLPDVGDIEPQLFDRTIFESYLAGLRDAGWTGDERVVRFAYAAFSSLKYGCFLYWLRDVPDETRHPIWERQFDRPFAEYVHAQARLTYYLLDLADEARALLTRGL